MYKIITDNKIKPRGWLRRQLETEAAGLAGNLDRIWSDIADSSWIGGAAEGWERVPYWLDGMIPLAYMLEDPVLLRVVDRYVGAILDRQCEDGWICPGEDRRGYDMWAYLLIMKVLALHCDVTGSERTRDALYRAAKCLYTEMKEKDQGLGGWGGYRWFEGLIPLMWLRDRYDEEWIVELARMLKEAGVDYYRFMDYWKNPTDGWHFENHIVNMGMMFKAEALSSNLLGEEYTDVAEEMWQHLYRYHGNIAGAFNGDECLSGPDNNRGFELCSVCELMYTCEVLYSLTEDSKWADRLERLAFNALPATLSDDMWTHQYDQQINQVACVIPQGHTFFSTNGTHANLFGLEPEYGCCTANMAQGWPKLAMSVFHRTEKGVICSLLLPATLSEEGLTVEIDTAYPFRHSAVITVEHEGDLELCIRIPSWVESVTLNGRTVACEPVIKIQKTWSGREELLLELGGTPSLVRCPDGLYYASYGAMLYSLPIPYEKKFVKEPEGGVRRPWDEYELYPAANWGYGFADAALSVVETEGDGVPFSSTSPSVMLKAKLAPADWKYVEGYSVAKTHPESNAPTGEAVEMLLHPYGATMLRLTEMPLFE